MVDRSATATVFGFSFQANAAIVLFLENIKDANTIRLESPYEDIDITLNDGTHILAQAKAIEDPVHDFRNINRNVKKSIQSLSEGYQKLLDDNCTCKSLIYITNSRRPIGLNGEDNAIFSGKSHRSYKDLTENGQCHISDLYDEVNATFAKELFHVYLLPFETDDMFERYKEVKRVIETFLGNNHLLAYYGNIDTLLDRWHRLMSDNGGTRNEKIILKKKELIWPLVNICTDLNNLSSQFIEDFDDDEFNELLRTHRELIENAGERFEFFTKIIYDFANFTDSARGNQRIMNFAKRCWRLYIEFITAPTLNEALQEKLIIIIIYSVLCKRTAINKIKEGVNICD